MANFLSSECPWFLEVFVFLSQFIIFFLCCLFSVWKMLSEKFSILVFVTATNCPSATSDRISEPRCPNEPLSGVNIFGTPRILVCQLFYYKTRLLLCAQCQGLPYSLPLFDFYFLLFTFWYIALQLLESPSAKQKAFWLWQYCSGKNSVAAARCRPTSPFWPMDSKRCFTKFRWTIFHLQNQRIFWSVKRKLFVQYPVWSQDWHCL